MLIFAQGWSNDKDGPGQRMIFYFKGCNLRCLYCGNPEGLHQKIELMYYPERQSDVPEAECCKDGSLDCRNCTTFECARIWHHPHFEVAGTEISKEEILRLALESKALFGKNGGVSFGGGEPTLQFAELRQTIELLHKNGINTTVESNASLPDYSELIDLTDYLISDCKAVDCKKHIALTGCDNTLIKKNLLDAARRKKNFMIRVPLITNYNDDDDELNRYTGFFSELNCEHMKNFGEALKVQCLRLHHMGMPKYRALGMDYLLENVSEPTVERAKLFTDAWKSAGLEVVNP
jgi:pyruvate formate lyase activating enzyme